MTKKVLLFTAFAGISYLTLSSYANGPAAGGAGNRTGSAGTSANCSTGGCHSANTTNTAASIAILSGSTMVNEYTPGSTYTVKIIGTNNSANLPKFGFQLSAVSGLSNNVQAGNFNSSGTPGVAVRTVGSLSLVEHSTPLAGTGSGTSWTYNTTFLWTAPAAGTGPVTFYLQLNAVNGNNTTTGDQPNSGTFTVNETPTGIHEVAGNINVSAYPNPTTNLLHISMENATAGKYALEAFDMTGKKLLSETVNVTGDAFETTVATQSWAAGMYHVVLSKDGNRKVVPVVKQ